MVLCFIFSITRRPRFVVPEANDCSHENYIKLEIYLVKFKNRFFRVLNADYEISLILFKF